MNQTIQEKIQQRRYQILVHSYIYYELNQNIVSDAKWSQWAMELVELQEKYPKESAEVTYYKAFKDFDGSSGFDLPKDDWIRNKALYLLNPPKVKKVNKKKQTSRRHSKLF